MTEFYRDDWLTIYQGDVRAVLPEIPADSVDCIVTSPPYWGLRDYGTASWTGGSEDCDHSRPAIPHTGLAAAAEASDGNRRNESGTRAAKQLQPFTHICGKCGAVRQDAQLGLERTPEEYVANLVAIFRELRRVLKPSGTCWLNLGDSYAAGGGSSEQRLDELGIRDGRGGGKKHSSRPSGRAPSAGLAQKQLVGIPWRVAFALQADGWYLRSDIIWSKPNPMPESVTDRPTKAHEYLFLLTKSARYYFDADAVREGYVSAPTVLNRVEVMPKGTGAAQPHRGPVGRGGSHATAEHYTNGGRNLRSVWTIATRPYPGAHFAVFPPELPERCIKAGSSERGVCPECGAPWERVGKVLSTGGGPGREASGSVIQDRGDYNSGKFTEREHVTTGWTPTCAHRCGVCGHGLHEGSCRSHMGGPGYSACRCLGESPHPAVVLDPFAGSGTTGMVANRLSRRAILIDLNGDYLRQQLKRNAQTPLGLAT